MSCLTDDLHSEQTPDALAESLHSQAIPDSESVTWWNASTEHKNRVQSAESFSWGSLPQQNKHKPSISLQLWNDQSVLWYYKRQ